MWVANNFLWSHSDLTDIALTLGVDYKKALKIYRAGFLKARNIGFSAELNEFQDALTNALYES